MRSLFGDDIPSEPQHLRRDKAHAAPPGTGPEGETCGDCKRFYVVTYHNKRYRKCYLMAQHWTHGPGSDIRAKDKACKRFQE